MPLPALANLARQHFFSLGQRLLATAYPQSCPVCDAFHERDQDPLCDRCRSAIDALAAEPYCHQCAKPLAVEGSPCPWCEGKGIRPYHQILRLGDHEDPLRKLILDLKYHRRWTTGELLADALADIPAISESLRNADILVPVPLHLFRQYQRGFNQSELLARRLGARFGKPALRAVRRIRNTPTQTRLTSVKARQENVKDAFALRSARWTRSPGWTSGASLAGKRIVVIDDVLTTGATLREVGRALLAAKPARLSAIILAVADPRHRAFQRI